MGTLRSTIMCTRHAHRRLSSPTAPGRLPSSPLAPSCSSKLWARRCRDMIGTPGYLSGTFGARGAVGASAQQGGPQQGGPQRRPPCRTPQALKNDLAGYRWVLLWESQTLLTAKPLRGWAKGPSHAAQAARAGVWEAYYGAPRPDLRAGHQSAGMCPTYTCGPGLAGLSGAAGAGQGHPGQAPGLALPQRHVYKALLAADMRESWADAKGATSCRAAWALLAACTVSAVGAERVCARCRPGMLGPARCGWLGCRTLTRCARKAAECCMPRDAACGSVLTVLQRDTILLAHDCLPHSCAALVD